MILATTIKALLVTGLAAGSLWRVAAPGEGSGLLALRATVHEAELIVTLSLPAVCLRLTAHLADELTVLSDFVCCGDRSIVSTRRA